MTSPRSLSTSFRLAIVKKNAKKVRKILSINPELVNLTSTVLNEEDNFESSRHTISPLFAATKVGSEEIINILVEYGADINEKIVTIKNNSPVLTFSLIFWVVAQNKVRVRELQLRVVELLIKLGADVNAKSVQEGTDGTVCFGSPLGMALSKADLRMAELLLSQGARLTGPQWNGKTPARYIYCHGIPAKIRINMLLLLMQYGLNLKFRDEIGNNLLNLYLYEFNARSNEDDSDDVKIVEILINSGVPVNDLDDSGYSPLVRSIRAHSIGLVSLLIKNGADIEQKIKGSFPLFYAVTVDDEKCVDLLLRNGANINNETNGWRALHIAALFHHKNLIEVLISNGAEFSSKNYYGETPMSVLDSTIDNYDECLITFVKEFARLNFENRTLSEFDTNFIKANPKILEHFERCTAELETMAKTKLSGSISIYSILNMTVAIKKLALLLKNQKILLKFEENLKKNFYFQRELEKNFQNAIVVRDTLETVNARLTSIFSNVLPDVIVRNLAKYISVEDLPLS